MIVRLGIPLCLLRPPPPSWKPCAQCHLDIHSCMICMPAVPVQTNASMINLKRTKNNTSSSLLIIADRTTHQPSDCKHIRTNTRTFDLMVDIIGSESLSQLRESTIVLKTAAAHSTYSVHVTSLQIRVVKNHSLLFFFFFCNPKEHESETESGKAARLMPG